MIGLVFDLNSIYKYTLSPWVIPLFKKLNCPKGLITNGDKEIQNNKIDVLSVRKYFDHIIIFDDPHFYKPSSVGLDLMLNVLNVDKCVYISDKGNDKKFAENANAYFINVNDDKFIERIIYCYERMDCK